MVNTWRPFSDDSFKIYGDNDRILVTDGDEVFVTYADHERLYFLHHPLRPEKNETPHQLFEREEVLLASMTHWMHLRLPEWPKICNKWPCKCEYHPNGKMGYSGYGDPMPLLELEYFTIVKEENGKK